MMAAVRLAFVCLGLACACSCRPVIDPDGSTLSGQPGRIGLLTFVADTIAFTTYDAFALQTSAIPDARVSLRLEGGGQAAYFDAQVRVVTTNSTVILSNLLIRFGDVDSSARFYQIRLQSTQFTSSLRIDEEAIISGTFSGLLEGTGVNAYGTTLRIKSGAVRIPFKPTGVH